MIVQTYSIILQWRIHNFCMGGGDQLQTNYYGTKIPKPRYVHI